MSISTNDDIIIDELNSIMNKINEINEINKKLFTIQLKINYVNNSSVENTLCVNEFINKINNNNIKQMKQTKQNKIYKSASLTFFDNEFGYLMCDEFRYKEKKNLIHPIGGKVETYDNELIDTAIREFIEETNLEQYPYIYINKLNKDILIENIKNIIKHKIKYFDLCINGKLKYYHRYYRFELSSLENISEELIEFKKSIIELPKFFNGNFKTEINNLEWIKIHDKNNLDTENISYLTEMFFKKIILFNKFQLNYLRVKK
jgi:8-oxo-dGTP pyrophosphatase MutT (NUDIX family)